VHAHPHEQERFEQRWRPGEVIAVTVQEDDVDAIKRCQRRLVSVLSVRQLIVKDVIVNLAAVQRRDAGGLLDDIYSGW
jgi:hypothetical protein